MKKKLRLEDIKVSFDCSHNDPYCGDCHNKLDFKTKAEKRLIKHTIFLYKEHKMVCDCNCDLCKKVEPVVKERKKK